MSLFGKRDAKGESQPAEPGIVWHGADGLRAMLVPITSLRQDERNARRHPERNIEAVRLSLRQFGQRKPVVFHADGVLVAGNGTHLAAGLEGWTHLAAVDASDLTREQALAYSLADNKSGDLAEWDYQDVAGLLRELPEALLDATGFAAFEREPLLKADWEPPTEGAGDGASHAEMVMIAVTKEQATIIRGAIDRLKEAEGDLSDGRALELICANFLAQ